MLSCYCPDESKRNCRIGSCSENYLVRGSLDSIIIAHWKDQIIILGNVIKWYSLHNNWKDAPSNFLLLFLSPFSPPNWPKAPAPKNCLERQRFCVGAYKIWSHRGAKSGHEMDVTRICTSNYLSTFGVIFHHTAHVTSRLKIQIQRLTCLLGRTTSSPLNQSGEAVAWYWLRCICTLRIICSFVC